MFDLEVACRIIKTNKFRRVVLQFPDEYLIYSTELFRCLTLLVNDNDVEIYITADSSYGSSVDDISALHLNTELIIYFGSDMSASGSIPILVLPPKEELSVFDCSKELTSYFIENKHFNEHSTKMLFLCSPSYFHCWDELHQSFSNIPNKIYGQVPYIADTNLWKSNKNDQWDNQLLVSFEQIGGMYVRSDVMNDENMIICYIGDKQEQIVNISLRMSQNQIVCYNPKTHEIYTFKGEDTKVFRERYGGVSKATDANTVGLIVGSMGLNETIIQSTLTRLQLLLTAAKKKYYTFVMGRLNEAKLCNFPEIDIYCIISNEDVSIVPPKTYHVPVITPYELELALGAHSWESFYKLTYDPTDNTTEALTSLVEAVHLKWRDNNQENDLDELQENIANNDDEVDVNAVFNIDNLRSSIAWVSGENGSSSSNSCCQETTNCIKYIIDTTKIEDHASSGYKSTCTSLVMSQNTDARKVVALVSTPVLEHFTQRTFQGLNPTVTEDERHNTKILPGQSGIAKDYKSLKI